MLELTYQELVDIVDDRRDDSRFEIIYDDIPRDGHSSQYIEDDGRQLRYFEFRDTLTGEVYHFSYVWHSEWSTEFPSCFLGDPPQGIQFVQVSVLNPPQPAATPVEPTLSPEAQADKDLMDQYRAVEHLCQPMVKQVPAQEVKNILAFLKTRVLSMYDLRARIIPLCIKYHVTHQSFWTYLQKKRSVWK